MFYQIQFTLCTVLLSLSLGPRPRADASRTPVYDIQPHLLELELELELELQQKIPRVVLTPLSAASAPEPLVLTPSSACVWCSGYDHYPRFTRLVQKPGVWRVQLSPVPLWVCKAGIYDLRVAWSNHTDGYVLWHFHNQTLCWEGLNPLTLAELRELDAQRDGSESGDRLETVFLEYAIVPLISVYLLTLCGWRQYKSQWCCCHRYRVRKSDQASYAEIQDADSLEAAPVQGVSGTSEPGDAGAGP